MRLWHVGYEFRKDEACSPFFVAGAFERRMYAIPAITQRQALDYLFDLLHEQGYETRFPLLYGPSSGQPGRR